MHARILILPGLYNSDERHWQTLWEQTLPGAIRVQQREWNRPSREEWVLTLDAAVRASEGPVVLAAHSLGCALTAWWAQSAAQPELAKVRGALLVAPPDVERADFPRFVTGFAPMPAQRLPFATIVVASSDDPWCAFDRARRWSSTWGSDFVAAGPRGHINADSALGDWAAGRDWLRQLAQ